MMSGAQANTGGGFLDQFNNSTLLNQPAGPAITLNPVSELDSERFQQLWMQLPIGCGGQPINKSLRLDLQFTTQMVESHVKENHI
jgi:hypothetical protein